ETTTKLGCYVAVRGTTFCGAAVRRIDTTMRRLTASTTSAFALPVRLRGLNISLHLNPFSVYTYYFLLLRFCSIDRSNKTVLVRTGVLKKKDGSPYYEPDCFS
ncbi:hypothetical protein HC766_09390, partial [Candidatus Gracilibacteria bacterium]|nr:hypothetical protein [Candidatus Gracilibacteria bacterium]